MPVYEYRCSACAAKTSVFRRSISTDDECPVCERCGSTETERAVSAFATPKTEQQVLENYGTPGLGASPEAYRDPRQIGRWVEQQFDDMGVEMPDQTRQMIDEARAGELPDPVKDL
jgi:putative FmdB family regulatory protein